MEFKFEEVQKPKQGRYETDSITITPFGISFTVGTPYSVGDRLKILFDKDHNAIKFVPDETSEFKIRGKDKQLAKKINCTLSKIFPIGKYEPIGDGIYKLIEIQL